jgi:heme/copper-type cytochrome/quinol oxidase subunit 3
MPPLATMGRAAIQSLLMGNSRLGAAFFVPVGAHLAHIVK